MPNVFSSRSVASLLLLLPVILLYAQYGSGLILGTVTDPTGALVPATTVVAKNLATGEVRTFTTDSSGNFQFNAVPSGSYSLTATAPSFKAATVSELVLGVNTQVRADIVMELGTVSESVQVKATTPQLQTNTAVLGTVIDSRTMLELPLNGRSLIDLVALTPATIRRATGGAHIWEGRSMAIGGVSNTSNNVMLDGADFSAVNANDAVIALSLDAIEEFKVQMNFMDASYGHGAAGIDMVTRRGGNSFHGSAYDFVRNRAFQAGQFFRPPAGAPRFSYNQFGASVGGRIKKDRTFFFGNYEGRRRRTGIILQGLVPTAAMQAGNFSALSKVIRDPSSNLPFPDNVIPKTRFNRITEQMLQYFPAPNYPSQRAGINYVATPSDRERRDQFTTRLDHRISSQGTLFGRYSFANDALVNAAYIPGKGLVRPDHTQNFSIGYTHLFRANLISETRLGFTKNYLARESDGDRYSTNYGRELGLKNLAAGPSDYTLPSVNLTGYAPGTPSQSSGFVGYGIHIVQNNIYYRAGETVTYIRGAHSLKIGGDVSRLMVGYDQGSNQNGIFNFSGNFTGDAFGDYLLGFPQSAVGGLGSVGDFGGVAKYSIGTQFQWFVQDDWKVSDRLTLNVGIRHELFQQWRGRLANFDLGRGRQLLTVSPDYYVPGVGLVKGSGAPGLPERPVNTDANDFAPRLGLAYRLGSKTTVRAGAGVFYALNSGGSSLGSMTSTVPYFVTANLVSSNARPELLISDLFPRPDQTPGSVTSRIDLNRRTGYIYQYNLNVQRQLRPGLLIEIAYLGNTGQKQVGSIFRNQPRLAADPSRPEPFSARSPYPNLNPGFSETANFQWSNYNSGYLKFDQRVSSGLSYTLSYTYAKLLDSGGAGQNMYNRRPERGLSDTDVRHNFIASYVYELPIGKGKRFGLHNRLLDGIAGRWQINGITNFRTGTPVTIGVANDLANVGTGGQRADATGVVARKLDPRTNGLLGLDRTAYGTPARGVFGNLARNTQPGFGANNWDFSAIKNFPVPWLGEASRLQFRFEWFNLFNHAQFLNPGATVNVPASFGFVTDTLDPRILQIAGRLSW